jgi:hypothetical protein
MIGFLLAFALVTGHDGGTPVPVKYRIEQRLESRVDLSGFGQGEQVQTQRFVWFTTLTYADSAGGQALDAVLDSLEVDLGIIPLPPGSVDSARGAAFHGFLNSWGRMTELSSAQNSTFTAVFESQLRGLHPRRKPGASAGEHWTDTLTVDTKTGRGETQVTTITTFTQGGAEQHAGRPATQLGAAFTTTTTGTVETPGGPAGVEGTGRGTATYYTGEDGRLLGGTSTTSGEGSVSLTMAPTPIGLKTSSTITITLIE